VKKLYILLIFLSFSSTALGETAVTIPYGEFKQLYTQRIRQDILKNIKEDPFVYTITNARYKMAVSPGGAVCRAWFTGSLISGKPGAFKLFSNKIIIREIQEVKGGALVCDNDTKSGILFFPSGAPAFSIVLTFFIPAGEDNNSAYIALEIPRAIKNTLEPTSGEKTVLLDVPGVKSQTDTYHFSTRPSLKIRFTKGTTARASDRDRRENLADTYTGVPVPPVVLNAVHCFTSFEESGNILSVITAEIPPEAGEIFTIQAVPGAEIWQCRINNKKIRVYKSKDGNWILPLTRGKRSRIELALLSQGEKIGLHGKLELTLPAMGLPARQVNITLGLPKRVELLSFQGPVTPSKPSDHPRPDEFSDTHCTPYFFSRSFHKGGAITMAVSYKEPVKKGNNS